MLCLYNEVVPLKDGSYNGYRPQIRTLIIYHYQKILWSRTHDIMAFNLFRTS